MFCIETTVQTLFKDFKFRRRCLIQRVERSDDHNNQRRCTLSLPFFRTSTPSMITFVFSRALFHKDLFLNLTSFSILGLQLQCSSTSPIDLHQTWNLVTTFWMESFHPTVIRQIRFVARIFQMTLLIFIKGLKKFVPTDGI